jgi:hypothetical protein
MIAIGNGSSRPASNMPIPGTSHATASRDGVSVTAAKVQPGRHGHRFRAAAPEKRRKPSSRGLRAAETRPWLGLRIIPNGCVLLVNEASLLVCPGRPVSRGVTRGRPMPRFAPSRKHCG